MGVLALAEYYSAIRPVKDVHSILVTTLGASILLDAGTQLVAGPSALQVPFFGGNNPITFLGGQAFPVEIGLIVLVIVIVVAFVIYGRFSLTGLALRGMSEDREAAQLRGINVRRLALGAFIFSGPLGRGRRRVRRTADLRGLDARCVVRPQGIRGCWRSVVSVPCRAHSSAARCGRTRGGLRRPVLRQHVCKPDGVVILIAILPDQTGRPIRPYR